MKEFQNNRIDELDRETESNLEKTKTFLFPMSLKVVLNQMVLINFGIPTSNDHIKKIPDSSSKQPWILVDSYVAKLINKRGHYRITTGQNHWVLLSLRN